MKKSRLSADDLYQIMAELGLNQADLAEVFRINQTTVSRWLSGTNKVPGYVSAWLSVKHPIILLRYEDGVE